MPLTNDPTEQALLARILSDPTDDAPRLILADFYDENATEANDLENVVTLLRIQCSERIEFRDFKVRFGSVYLGKWPKEGWPISAGLISVWEKCPHTQWEQHADEILASHPVEVVELTTYPSVIPIEFLDRDEFWDTTKTPTELLKDAWERQWTASRPWLKFVRPKVFRSHTIGMHIGIPNELLAQSAVDVQQMMLDDIQDHLEMELYQAENQ